MLMFGVGVGVGDGAVGVVGVGITSDACVVSVAVCVVVGVVGGVVGCYDADDCVDVGDGVVDVGGGDVTMCTVESVGVDAVIVDGDADRDVRYVGTGVVATCGGIISYVDVGGGSVNVVVDTSVSECCCCCDLCDVVGVDVDDLAVGCMVDYVVVGDGVIVVGCDICGYAGVGGFVNCRCVCDVDIVSRVVLRGTDVGCVVVHTIQLCVCYSKLYR